MQSHYAAHGSAHVFVRQLHGVSPRPMEPAKMISAELQVGGQRSPGSPWLLRPALQGQAQWVMLVDVFRAIINFLRP